VLPPFGIGQEKERKRECEERGREMKTTRQSWRTLAGDDATGGWEREGD